jgi:C1A family cysteine protease
MFIKIIFLPTILTLALLPNRVPAQTQTREAALRELEQIQSYVDKYQLDWTPGLTSRLLNYTPEERSYGLKRPDNWREICEQHLPPTSPDTWFRSLPESFNWEDSGKVTPVRDQDGCGSCWIFAATAALEAAYSIHKNRPMDLSEQAVLSCFSRWWGCNGGWVEDVYNYFYNEGAHLEACMPYMADDEIPCVTNYCPVVANLYEWFYIYNNVNYLKAAVMMGPVAVCFNVYSDFNAYVGGCYSHYPEPGVYPEAGHCVLITGWDDNICPGGAWRVKNSWGTWWGEEGYFWIKYENNCEFGGDAMLLSINRVEILTNPLLPDASLCGEYDLQFEAAGGTPPYTWWYKGGIYPSGIVLEPNGLFHGDPTDIMSCGFTLWIKDSSRPTARDNMWCQMKVTDEGCVCGDVNSNGIINIEDLTFMIDYYFNDGPAPNLNSIGDINCDGRIGIYDIVMLNRHIFQGADIACCPVNRKGAPETINIREINEEQE